MNYYRSPTAEDIFNKNENFIVKSAGTHSSAVKVITRDLVEWADLIFAMEPRHKEHITQKYPMVDDKIIVLHIPDIFERGDPELVKLLEEKVTYYLSKINRDEE